MCISDVLEISSTRMFTWKETGQLSKERRNIRARLKNPVHKLIHSRLSRLNLLRLLRSRRCQCKRRKDKGEEELEFELHLGD